MRSVIVCVLSGMALATAVTAQQQAPPTPPPCVAAGDVQFICGQRAPEDLVVVPGGQWVVAGAYAGAGGINLIRVSNRTSIQAYPAAGAAEMLDANA